MILHVRVFPPGRPPPAAMARAAHPLLLLGIDRHHGLPLPLERLDPPVDVPELGIPVRVVLALDRLAVGLEAVAQVVEEAVDRSLADGMPSGPEPRRQSGRTLARPPQRRHRGATGHRIYQGFEITQQVRIVIDQRLPPAPRTA